MRSGTTWLHHQLDAHPQIWTPPLKELFYLNFYLGKSPRQILWHSAQPALTRAWWRRALRLIAPHKAIPDLLRSPANYRWSWVYTWWPRNLKTYEHLFRPAGRRISGEFTPIYLSMDPDRIQMLARHHPRLRILVCLRHPVDRLWSHASLAVQHGEGDDPVQLFEDFLENRKFAFRFGLYSQHLEKWWAAFPSAQIKINFFEDIRRQPAKVLRENYRFLGVPNSDFQPPGLDQKINLKGKKSNRRELPPRLARRAHELYRPEMERLAELFPKKTGYWAQKHAPG